MNVLKFANINHVDRLDKAGKHFEVGSNVWLIRSKLEVVQFAFELDRLLVYKASVFVVLQLVHEQLLVSVMALLTVQKNSSERIENLVSFIILWEDVCFPKYGYGSLTNGIDVEADACVQGCLDNHGNNLFIIDEGLIINADNIDEGSSPYSFI